MKESNLTVIAAIHDLNIAAMYCDKLYVIKDGEVITCGTPREVLTKKFIKEVYEVDAEIVEDSKDQIHILYSKQKHDHTIAIAKIYKILIMM